MTSESTPKRTRSIVVEYDLPYPPEKVWRVLTEPELVAQWLMPNDLQPIVGHQFTFQSRPVEGWDGKAHCEVLIVEPCQRLQYSWAGGSDAISGYGHRLDTVVTWTLSPAPDGGTHVRLDHDGFTDDDAFAFENMGKGWNSFLTPRMSSVLAELG